MTLKIDINGFSQSERLVARLVMDHLDVELVDVNDLIPADNLAYLFKYDSTHEIYEGTVEAKENGISINNYFVSYMAIKKLAELPWSKLGADYVVESTNEQGYSFQVVNLMLFTARKEGLL